MKKRVHIYYSGRVQGVGFRFTAESAAADLGLTGWVKNLPNGRVEVLAEGEEPFLKEFLAKIKKTMGHYIKDADTEWDDATGEFKNFEIALH